MKIHGLEQKKEFGADKDEKRETTKITLRQEHSCNAIREDHEKITAYVMIATDLNED